MKIDRTVIGQPCSLPLERDAFGDALHKGHGRALIHVRKYGADGVDDLIVDACLHDWRFDRQCEVDRARWMLEIVDAAGLEMIVCEKIAAALGDGSGTWSFWDTSQQCQLALVFAQRGRDCARSALYSALRKNDNSADLIAAREIIELDGADGLLFVAERLGAWLEEEPGVPANDYPLMWYDEHHGRGSAQRLLELAATRNERVSCYWDYIRTRSSEGAGAKRRKALYIKPDILRFGVRGKSRWEEIKSMSADDLIHQIEAGAPGMGKYAYSGWGKSAEDNALRTVADRMFRESNPDRLARFLGVFQHRPLPEFDDRLLDLACHPDPDVRWISIFVLANHKHPRVRALALERLRAGRHNEKELALFRNNYCPGDWRLIRDELRLPTNADEVHRILSDLLDVFQHNSAGESEEPLMLVYERSPCTICRSQAVRTLHSAGKMPDWLREECRFDADEDIRRTVA